MSLFNNIIRNFIFLYWICDILIENKTNKSPKKLRYIILKHLMKRFFWVYLFELSFYFRGENLFSLPVSMYGWMDGWMGGGYLLRSLSGGLRENKLGLPEEETGEQGRRRRKSRGAHQQRHLTQLRARAHTQAKWARERRRRASQLPVVSFCGLPLGGGEVWCPGSSRILLPTL
jgi:hypothetical protein